MKVEFSVIENRLARITSIEAELSNPVTMGNRKRYQELLREHAALKELKALADRYVAMATMRQEAESLLSASSGADAELREMASADIAEANTHLPALEKAVLAALLPSDPADERSTIMEIRAGTGGEEAALFAADLHRMYTRYAESKGWRVEVLDASVSDMGGYKEMVFEIEGANVFRVLRYESGVHRVQRVPATEAQGRIHTSAATVAVLPEADEIDEIIIKPEDVRIDLYRASGAGGQKVNKTESAVRLTHIPTGIVVQCQDERSQHRNRDKAMRVLKARLLDRAREDDHRKTADTRRSQIGSGDRSERIRTYNFPQNRVTDHRINLTLYSLDRVIEGDLDPLLVALYDRDIEMRLEKLDNG